MISKSNMNNIYEVKLERNLLFRHRLDKNGSDFKHC